MTTRRSITAAALAATLALTTLAAPAMAEAPAAAQTDQTEDPWEEARLKVLQAIKDHADAAVEQRLRSIDEMRRWLRENEHVTPDHEAALKADLTATERGLIDLNEQIQATTTIEAALPLTEQIASDYRVYLVLVPKAAGVVIGDTVDAIADKLLEAGDGVQVVIDALEGHGFDVEEIQESLDKSMRHATAAGQLGSGAANAVIGLDASDWPSPADSTINGAKRDLDASGAEIRASVEELKRTIRLIQQVAG